MYIFLQFLGWYDCPLSPKGHEEVIEAGQLIKKEGLKPDVAFTSLLQRAIRTLWHVLEQTELMWIPIHKAWELNERHYGRSFVFVYFEVVCVPYNLLREMNQLSILKFKFYNIFPFINVLHSSFLKSSLPISNPKILT